MSEKKKAVVIVSGGLDSTTLLYYVRSKGYECHALSFDYGQKHKKELSFAQKTCKELGIPHKIIDLSALNSLAPSALTRKDWKVPEGHYEDATMKQTVVPNRNMVMLALATAYAISIKADYLFYGAHAGDHAIYPDCRPEFVQAMRKAIELCDWHVVKLEAPFINLKKSDIVALGLTMGVKYENTWSCYVGGEKPCGKCGTCVERLEAFQKNGVKDPLVYA